MQNFLILFEVICYSYLDTIQQTTHSQAASLFGIVMAINSKLPVTNFDNQI